MFISKITILFFLILIVQMFSLNLKHNSFVSFNNNNKDILSTFDTHIVISLKKTPHHHKTDSIVYISDIQNNMDGFVNCKYYMLK